LIPLSKYIPPGIKISDIEIYNDLKMWMAEREKWIIKSENAQQEKKSL
jgi:hypothetical protein